MRYLPIVVLLVTTIAAADPSLHTPSKKEMICASVEYMLEICHESYVNKTTCKWIDPPGHAKGYVQMIEDHWLSEKKFEAVCHRVCAGKLTVKEALSRFCPGWRPQP